MNDNMRGEFSVRVARAIADADGDHTVMEHHRRRALAAIEAMREPTGAMLEAGYNAGTAGYAEEAKLVWQAMVDAALVENKK